MRVRLSSRCQSSWWRSPASTITCRRINGSDVYRNPNVYEELGLR